MRKFLTSLLAGSLLVWASGCGPELSEEDLGTVITNPGKLPGIAEDYDLGLPPLEPEPKKDATTKPPEEG